MQVLESKIENKAVALVYKYLGIEGDKLSILGKAGYPDRIFWLPGGKPLMIEFKAPGEEPRPKQKQVHNYLRELGYRVEVHDNAIKAFESVIAAVDTTQLSEESLEILARASSICPLLRSRAGEDGNYIGCDQVFEATEASKEGSVNSPLETIVRSVAYGIREVGGLQRIEDSYITWPEEE